MAQFDHVFIEPSDFGRSLNFYKETLGWKHVDGWGGNGKPRGAFLRSEGGMTVVMAENHENKGDHAKEGGINGHRPTIHLNVDDIDRAFEKLPKGQHIAVTPEKTHWGTKWFVVSDPDGNLFAFESKQA